MADYNFVRKGWNRSIDVGSELRLLFYDDETCIEHKCKGVDGEGSHMIIAPNLGLHQLIETDSGVTVSPSILCPDCGLHGFIRDNVWSSV